MTTALVAVASAAPRGRIGHDRAATSRCAKQFILSELYPGSSSAAAVCKCLCVDPDHQMPLHNGVLADLNPGQKNLPGELDRNT
jgi:hypothetical protein